MLSSGGRAVPAVNEAVQEKQKFQQLKNGSAYVIYTSNILHKDEKFTDHNLYRYLFFVNILGYVL